MIVKAGKEDLLKLLFNLSGQAALVALGAGSGSTAATVDDTTLETELTGNATRKSLTKLDGGTPLIVEDETTTIGANTYHKKVACRAIFPTTDGNNGSDFREFALFSSATFAAGIMFNRYVAGANIPKDASTEIDVDTTVRF